MERKADIKRKTSETDINLKLDLQTIQKTAIDSGIPFFDHMLLSMARHGRFSIELKCVGDREVDFHHSIEDIGICLGQAFKKALGDKAGIYRFGDVTVPMDDALTLVALDLSGRSYFKLSGVELRGYINDYSEELTGEFLRSFSLNGGINLHVKVLDGNNAHHIHESIFKALGIALCKACAIDDDYSDEIPSTKGVIV